MIVRCRFWNFLTGLIGKQRLKGLIGKRILHVLSGPILVDWEAFGIYCKVFIVGIKGIYCTSPMPLKRTGFITYDISVLCPPVVCML